MGKWRGVPRELSAPAPAGEVAAEAPKEQRLAKGAIPLGPLLKPFLPFGKSQECAKSGRRLAHTHSHRLHLKDCRNDTEVVSRIHGIFYSPQLALLLVLCGPKGRVAGVSAFLRQSAALAPSCGLPCLSGT